MTLTLIVVLLGLLAGSVYALWRAHEEAKAERQKFQRIAQANSESRQWPAPCGPKGGDWQKRRVG